jgi:integrase
MSDVSGLQLRGKTYYARLRVPDDLRPVVGKRELTKTLQTSDKRVAKQRGFSILAAWEAMFAELRAGPIRPANLPGRPLTPEDVEHSAWWHHTAALDRLEAARHHRPTKDEIEAARRQAEADVKGLGDPNPIAVLAAAVDWWVKRDHKQLAADTRGRYLKELRKHLDEGETVLIDHEVEAYVAEHQLEVRPGSSAWREIAYRMMRAELEVQKRAEERDRGEFGGQPSDPMVKPVPAPRRPVAPASETIPMILEQFVVDNSRGVSRAWMDTIKRDVGLFLDLVGRDAPMSAITRAAVREWKALLRQFPVKATNSNAFQGLNMRTIVEANSKAKPEDRKSPISDRTVNRHISSLSAFCTWAVANDHLEQNPCTGQALAKQNITPRVPFTIDQLNTLFRSPLFTGCAGTEKWADMHKPGLHLIRDYRYWVPLIMLYSGARNGEIAQLAVDDVRLMGDVWAMHITDEGEGDKSVKTKGSRRVVPIHPELIRLGLLDYHKARKEAGGVELFPGAERNARGQMMADFSRNFGKYLRAIGLKQGRGLSLYSFRHGTIDALRAKYLNHEFKIILGHDKGDMTSRYGSLHQGTLERRVEIINTITYPGLSLDHLAPTGLIAL